MIKQILKAISILFCIYSADLMAINVDSRLNGYFTIGAATTSANDPQKYLAIISDEKIDLDYNSLLGLQGVLKVNDFSLISQIVVSGEDDWDVNEESWKWFYLNYDFNDKYSVKVGRFLNDVFFMSRYKYVGYAYPWIRPPRELYSQAAYDDITGIGFQYDDCFESFNITLHAAYTSDNRDVGLLNWKKKEKIINVSITDKDDTLELRLGYSRSKGSYNKREVLEPYYSDILVRMGYPRFLADMAANTIVSEDWFDADNIKSQFYSIGFRYEDHNILILGEYAENKTTDMSPSPSGYYITFGYQFDKIQPHITFSQGDHKDMYDKYFKAKNPVNEGFNELLVNTVYNLGYGFEQKRITYGLRYDPIRNLAVKAEIHKIYANGGRGYFTLPMDREYLYMLAVTYMF
ncbi:MAG: hypothetical protein D6B27_05530 [Gammaproteobacteria bacterium]|nr:MAG: hypothetical protein D6B27_05530 [Gammaproteobacteria bacterium]